MAKMAQPGNLPAGELDGAGFGPEWVIPFAGLLLSIALMPLIAPKFWHAHFPKVAAFWAAAGLIPLFALRPFEPAMHAAVHTLAADYVPFVILLGALFIVAGGITLKGRIGGTPLANTAVIAFGAAIASLIGTTGAAILLVRPLIRSNKHRRRPTHIFVFFIFLVANIGGALTPLGDPPLFLGFLAGVRFGWFAEHLAQPMAVAAVLLLALFYALDLFVFWPNEDRRHWPKERGTIAIEGGVNLLLLVGVLGAVLLSGIWKPGIELSLAGVHLELQSLARDAALVILAIASLKLTSKDGRVANGFSWFPIEEVAILFAAIFLTMIPLLAMLKAGEAGAMAPLIELTEGAGGQEPWRLFWITGLLSSCLDNAPTFLVFFNVAGGDAATLMSERAHLLEAISAGAVFMGALTYIGNAPNFLVRSIAEEQGIAMPSFFGFIGWSAAILLPVFGLLTGLFFLG
jgi:Na+/H+ antiporter NhaD/arsenite permease-like protein